MLCLFCIFKNSISFVFIQLLTFFCPGSSDKEQDSGTPEKLARTTTSERKRKRKVGEEGGIGSGGPQPSGGKPGPRLITDSKKINDYFVKHGSSPIRHGGAKSPSPAQQGYPMVSLM